MTVSMSPESEFWLAFITVATDHAMRWLKIVYAIASNSHIILTFKFVSLFRFGDIQFQRCVAFSMARIWLIITFRNIYDRITTAPTWANRIVSRKIYNRCYEFVENSWDTLFLGVVWSSFCLHVTCAL